MVLLNTCKEPTFMMPPPLCCLRSCCLSHSWYRCYRCRIVVRYNLVWSRVTMPIARIAPPYPTALSSPRRYCRHVRVPSLSMAPPPHDPATLSTKYCLLWSGMPHIVDGAASSAAIPEESAVRHGHCAAMLCTPPQSTSRSPEWNYPS